MLIDEHVIFDRKIQKAQEPERSSTEAEYTRKKEWYFR